MVQVIIQTRFSFFGKSGWKSTASKVASMLFEKERMERRFFLFENITLPSLKTQTDDNFLLYVLSSKLMPKVYKDRLIDIVHSEIGPERGKVFFEDPRPAERLFRSYVWKKFNHSDLLAQTVLDDDDAFADDFVNTCQKTSTELASTFNEELSYSALSFPKGYLYDITRPTRGAFLTHNHPLINLGLTWVGRASEKKTLY